MKDYIVRIMTKTGNIRALACVTTHLVDQACQQHGTYPTAAAALGRALTGGALMGALLKDGQRVALKFEGNGPLRKLLVEADSTGIVRGYVGDPRVDLPPRDGKFDVAAALGHAGFLTVTKDLRLKEPYKGVVQLYTSEIAEDLAYYLVESEQIPSAVGLGTFVEPSGTVSAAGGFLIQSLPPADDTQIDTLIRQIQRMPSITELLRSGATPETILEEIFSGIPYDILEQQPLAFQCSCSKEKMERALLALGQDDLTSLLETHDPIEVVCEFCRARYHFTHEEAEQLLKILQNGKMTA